MIFPTQNLPDKWKLKQSPGGVVLPVNQVPEKFKLTKEKNLKLEKAKLEEQKAKAKADWLESTIGQSLETILGLPEAAKSLFLEEPAKRGAGVMLEGSGQEYQPAGALEKFVLGNKPVKELSKQGKDILQFFGVPEKQAKELGYVAGGVMLGLDMTGLGGKSKAIKTLVEIKDIGIAKKVLKAMGVADDIAKDYAPIIAKTNKEKDMIVVIKAIEKTQNKTKLVGQGVKDAETIGKTEPELVQTVRTGKEIQSQSGPIAKPSQPVSGLPKVAQVVGGNISLPDTNILIQKSQDPIQTVIKALKEAKPIRKGQEAIYSAQRSKQTARIVAMGKKVPGEQGYFAQLGQLKGEMPRVEFEGIRSKITQPVVDDLFNIVEKNTYLTPFEKITAKTGLAKLLGAQGGKVPTKGELSLLSEIFPDEFIQTILDKRPLIQKVWEIAGGLLNLPRAIMASADLSAPLRQGIFLIGRSKQFVPAFGNMFKYAFSERAYQGMMEGIKSRPTYRLMREAGLSLTEMGSTLSKREEAFMSNLAERIPVFGPIARGSNRAYSGFLNKLRADVFDDLVKKATDLGVLKSRPNVINDIAKFVNSATGRGDLGFLNRATVAMNAAFFSPRLIASRVNLLNPVYYIKLDPFVRKEALKSLLSFSAVSGTVLGLAKLGGTDVGIDPRSADFGKIKMGDTRYDVLGGFQQYIVLGSRLLSGQMVSSTTGKEFTLGEGYKPTTRVDILGRFFASKFSPIASFSFGLLKGQTTLGEPFRLGPEIADRFIPMLIQDMYDLYKARKLEGILMSFPGAFGVGSQTYQDLVPLESKTATGKPTIAWRSQPTLGEALINKITGTKIEPVAIKETYDKVQVLLRQGKNEEAKIIVNGLSENDYALYKKFKEKDTRIANDEIKARLIPIYKKNKELIRTGKGNVAQEIVDSMTDQEYKIYETIKAEDYRKVQ